MWHVETDYFALAIFMIMLVKTCKLRQMGEELSGNAFFYVLVLSVINVVVDIISSTAMNVVTNWWFYQITMTVYVLTMPLLAAAWVSYSYVIIHQGEPEEKIKKAVLFIMAPYVGYAILGLSNPFTGLFFQLTSNMEYSRGILFMPLGVGFIMLYSLLGVIMVWFNRKKIIPRSNVFLMAVFFLSTAISIWVQLANPGWLIINACYAVVYVWCDMTLEEQRREVLYAKIKNQNAQLEETAKKAELAAHAKTEFLSRMSHDIRTPLNAIIGLTYLAKMEKEIKVIREYLDNIGISSNFLLGLINDILDMSKIESGELELKAESYEIDEFRRELDTVIRPLADAKQINFQVIIHSNVPCIVVDKLRYNQIFFNLLSNAVKFTPEGGAVELQSELISQKEGLVGIRYTIKDNGIGMSEKFIPHLFEAFTQERNDGNEKEKGSGLGLPIVKSLVDAMHGKITVKSVLGKGTVFVVDLYTPVAKVTATEKSNVRKNYNLEGKKILLVEDNYMNILVASKLLKHEGCEITVAKNGAEAVSMFEKSEIGFFDAILMDVRMPVMNGLEATRAIRQAVRRDAATVPILAMTADAFVEEKRKTLEAGMNAHLSKPINPGVLYEELSRQINGA